ncbi:MAG: type II secretion system protein [Deltaproteobacteria bacterium]|nr:type II secretion system protein [Deltaproteobacteria bacterium]
MPARGLTILEVLVALVIVALATAMVSSVVSAQFSAERAFEHERNALEVAHRIILQHIDDETVLHGQPNRVEQGGFTYRFEIERVVLQIRPQGTIDDQSDRPVRAEVQVVPRASLTADQIIAEKLQRVTVRVFHDDAASGARPLAQLSRVFNPFADPERAIDRVIRMLQDDLDQMIRQ